MAVGGAARIVVVIVLALLRRRQRRWRRQRPFRSAPRSAQQGRRPPTSPSAAAPAPTHQTRTAASSASSTGAGYGDTVRYTGPQTQSSRPARPGAALSTDVAPSTARRHDFYIRLSFYNAPTRFGARRPVPSLVIPPQYATLQDLWAEAIRQRPPGAKSTSCAWTAGDCYPGCGRPRCNRFIEDLTRTTSPTPRRRPGRRRPIHRSPRAASPGHWTHVSQAAPEWFTTLPLRRRRGRHVLGDIRVDPEDL